MADPKPPSPPRPPHAHLVIAGPAPRQQFGQYDEAEFKVPSCDPKTGESVPVRFKIHPGYIGQIEKTFYSQKLPYETPDAIFRHALKRHCEWMLELDRHLGGEPVPSIMHNLAMIARTVFEEERMAGFLAGIDKIEQVVRQINEFPGGDRRSHYLIGKLWGDIREMPAGYWRTVYRNIFRKRFGALMKRKPQSASLVLIGEYTDLELDEEFDFDDGGDGEEEPPEVAPE